MLAVVIIAAWVLVALAVAPVVGRGIRMADRRAPLTDHLSSLPADLTVDDILRARVAQPSN